MKNSRKTVRVPDIVNRKGNDKIVMLTAYDFTMARLLGDTADILLVGDSLGCVVQGEPTTLSVTLDQMIYHAQMVQKGAGSALVVGDLPFGSYQGGSAEALNASIRMVKEAGVGAVKFEGGRSVCDSIEKITAAGIPVMAHLGLTPQSFHAFGGNKVQAKDLQAAKRLIEDAQAVEKAGAFAVVLEAIPADLAQKVTSMLSIPTIGIGAGAGCDGQVLVINDMVGLNTETAPMKFNKEYCAVRDMIHDAAQQYARDVKAGTFPTEHHSYTGLVQAADLASNS